MDVEEFEGNYNVPKKGTGKKRPVQGAHERIPKPSVGYISKGLSGKVSRSDSVKNLGSKPGKAAPGKINCSQNSEKTRPESKTRQSYSNYNTSAGDKKSAQVTGASLRNESTKSSTNLRAAKNSKQIPQVSRVQEYKHSRSSSLVNSQTLASEGHSTHHMRAISTIGLTANDTTQDNISAPQKSHNSKNFPLLGSSGFDKAMPMKFPPAMVKTANKNLNENREYFYN